VLGAPWLSAGLAAKTASEMTYSVSGGALNSTPANQPMLECCHFCCCSRLITSEWKMADNAEMIVAVRARGFIAVFGGRAESLEMSANLHGNVGELTGCRGKVGGGCLEKKALCC